ncbi:MAG: type II/IV secretion system ATPase subunit, partial [Candidatus Heimdallarchaeota archaeon]|nr:type II/IV secretion system ATPase subunit [Candidatus Heimdallarchaeota archaeon]
LQPGNMQAIQAVPIQYLQGTMQNQEDEDDDDDDEVEEEIETIDLENLDTEVERVLKENENELTSINIKYPVSPPAPKEGEKVFAWAHIFWDKAKTSIIYRIIEPHIDSADKKNIDKIKQIIEDEINVDFKSFSKFTAKDYVTDQIKKIINRFGLIVSVEKLTIYEYYIIRDFIGFGILQPILDDENIEDISCDGVSLPLFIYHRDPKFGSIESTVKFDDPKELDNFVRTLAQRSGRSLSMASPLLDGALPDGSRLQATLATDIAKKGSNFTIRRFSKNPLTPIHLLKFKSMDAKILAYLWFAIEHSSSVFIVGATATGKTSILNSLSQFIKPTDKIVSIEDTPEIRLPHEHWIQELSREGFGESGGEGSKLGEVSMFDLLKGSLRQRPDYIIVGEIRGKEAAVLFQQMATGHPGMSTFHADSLHKVINRLLTRPINLPPALLESLDIVVFLKRIRYGDTYIRRTVEIAEIKGFNVDKSKIKSNTVFRWNADNDSHYAFKKSYLLGKISKMTGLSTDTIKQEIQNRTKVLEWMNDMYITNYKRVGEVIRAYYNDQDKVMDLIGYD